MCSLTITEDESSILEPTQKKEREGEKFAEELTTAER